MIIDVSDTDLDLLLHALKVLQDNDGSDDGAAELETRLKAQNEASAERRDREDRDMARLQKHVAAYFELSTPLPYEPNRPVAVRLHRDAQLHGETISTCEALLASPLWKLIREWKAER